jgi:hypothetical protein
MAVAPGEIQAIIRISRIHPIITIEGIAKRRYKSSWEIFLFSFIEMD